jgi:hypothetical protein
MQQMEHQPASIVELLCRAIEALKKADVTSMEDVLSSCARVERAVSSQEQGQALAQRRTLQKLLEHTRHNLHIFGGETGRTRAERWRH